VRAKRFLRALHSPDQDVRDGQWLKEGLEMFQLRCQNSDQISMADATNGAIAFGYVRGVLDVILPAMLKGHAIDETATADEDPGDEFYAPVAQTGYLSSGSQAQHYVQIILNYLYARTDQADEEACHIISDALLERFSKGSGL
jgi:hypothetical protein